MKCNNWKVKKIWGMFAFVAFFAAFTAVAMLLWNALIPSIFGLTTINFWQTAGLLILARLFFGGMGHGRFKGPFKGRRGGHHKGFEEFRNKEFREKMQGMSRDERREYIRNRMSKHFNRFDDYVSDEEKKTPQSEQ